MRWRKTTVVFVALAGLVLTTAGSCDPGTVKERTWTEDSLGNKTCTLRIRPDDMDSAEVILTKQHRNRCNQCPKGARWPECAKAKPAKGNKPSPTVVPWKPGDK